MDKGLILVIVGGLLCCTIFGVLIGAPLTLIGAYFVYKSLKNPNKEVEDELKEKQEELKNIDEKLSKLEADKEKEIEQKLSDKHKELDNIQQKLNDLEAQRTAEVEKKLKTRKEELSNLDEKYEKLSKEKEEELDEKIHFKELRHDTLSRQVRDLERQKGDLQDDIAMQEYGLYEPKYNFVNATAYKERLDAVRRQQKQMIKDKTAAMGATEWTIDGSKSKGRAFINANIKQILRSFNNETEVIISKVKHSNIESSKKRIQKSFDVLNRLYSREHVHLTQGYLNLKFDEMHLAYEYEVKKQEEKEELKEAREREREEKKLQKELEKEKKKFEKENQSINSEIEEVKQKMAQAADDEKAKLEAEIAKLQAALDKNNEEVKKINEWKEKPGAGYVYIISNIGSFGKNVFKIGVTRRENPEDRIRELSSASVPFRYDAHVFIFSKDAYDLESKLHKRFDKQRVNKINMRKEFFKISIEDVKQIVEENKGAVHSFVENPDAEEYYDTLKIEKQMGD